MTRRQRDPLVLRNGVWREDWLDDGGRIYRRNVNARGLMQFAQMGVYACGGAPPLITYTGTTNGELLCTPGVNLDFTASGGSWTITVARPMTFSVEAAAGGGAGGLASYNAGTTAGACGGGAAGVVRGGTVTLLPYHSYTLTIAASVAGSTNGQDTSLYDTTTSTYLILCVGGTAGGTETGSGGAGGGVTTAAGGTAVTGGDGGTKSELDGDVAPGGCNANGAGGGGAGGPRSGSGFVPVSSGGGSTGTTPAGGVGGINGDNVSTAPTAGGLATGSTGVYAMGGTVLAAISLGGGGGGAGAGAYIAGGYYGAGGGGGGATDNGSFTCAGGRSGQGAFRFTFSI